ncbi:MAG TPA: hypothetical protein VFX05_12000 [Casimicrobiaceae bacterium]|nr:hypothetical protein [Casimicrobiaceae bacterium]
MADVADPRRFPSPDDAPADARHVHRLALASLRADTGQDAQVSDAELGALIDRELAAPDPVDAGHRLAAWLATAPSVAVHRHVWRAIVARTRAVVPDGGIVVSLFAIPLVIVAGVAGGADARASLPGTLPDRQALADVLMAHGALGGNRTFALAGSLVAADALDVAALPALLAARRRALDMPVPLEAPPAPLALPAGESVHLRFLVGSAVGAAGVDITREDTTGRWGMPLTKALAAQLVAPGATLLALPRPAFVPPAAVAHGRLAQRDVSAQLFASHAIRELRASVGEPAAVISAHRAADAAGGGELRLSLSSPFSPRDAYGFRCPILANERAGDAATMLVDLLADARVTDVRLVAGVHDDRDPVTGGPLLFKPVALPAGG